MCGSFFPKSFVWLTLMDLSPVGLRWLVLKTNCLHWIIPHPTSLISVYADEIADITEPVQTVTESLSVLLSLRRQSQWRHQKTIATVLKWPMMFSPSSDIWQFVAVPMMSDDEWSLVSAGHTGLPRACQGCHQTWTRDTERVILTNLTPSNYR